MSNSSRLAVIGLGNLSRKDDGIGILLLNELKKKPLSWVDYLEYGTASFDLVNRIKDYPKVILMDGIDAGLNPGEMKLFNKNEIRSVLKPKMSSTHELDLQYLLDLCNTIGTTSDIIIAGIQIKDASFGDNISGELKNNLVQYLQLIKKAINN